MGWGDESVTSISKIGKSCVPTKSPCISNFRQDPQSYVVILTHRLNLMESFFVKLESYVQALANCTCLPARRRRGKPRHAKMVARNKLL